jgi:DUF4097 and DUF4098 domain-containing protein YvlB
MRKFASVFTGLVLCVGLSACIVGLGVNAERSGSETVPVSRSLQRVAIETANGEVIVQSENRTDILLEWRKTAQGTSQQEADRMVEEIRIEKTTPSADLMRIAATFPNSPGNRGCVFHLRLPESLALDIHTSNGKLEFRGLSPSLELVTSNGAILAILDEPAKRIRAATSNGPVQITGDATEDLSIVSSNSQVELQTTLTGAYYDIRNSNGSITLLVPQSATGRLEAETSNSRVQVDLPLQSDLTDNENRASGLLNGSDTRIITLHTSNGRVSIGTQP